ncbi:hypothetical protein M8J75_002322 [Diaphorina citri]|nr:hypothetical protein M8J75_002322 [Diaphorina citri]KAI5720076.1 hypothetical protein M8J77_001516 [Diaphorina citri]
MIVVFHMLYYVANVIWNKVKPKLLPIEETQEKSESNTILNEAPKKSQLYDLEKPADGLNNSAEYDDYNPDKDVCVYDLLSGKLTFVPPLYIQRYQAVVKVLTQEEHADKIHKIAEYGCAEFSMLKYYKKLTSVGEVLFVDIDEDLLVQKSDRVNPFLCEHLIPRQNDLSVSLYCGDVSVPDARMVGADVVIAIELIEHLYPPTLENVPYNVFGVMQPYLVIITTPNGEFNYLFDDYVEGTYRHDDHKFEWTREQFKCWAENIVARYPMYSLNISGIGPPPSDKSEAQYGHCSQMAVFTRIGERVAPTDVELSEPYKLIKQVIYPVKPPETRTREQILFDEMTYLLFSWQEDLVPLSKLYEHLQSWCDSVEELRGLLEKNCRRLVYKESEGEYYLVDDSRSQPLISDEEEDIVDDTVDQYEENITDVVNTYVDSWESWEEPASTVEESDKNVWELHKTAGEPVDIVGKSDNNVWESDNNVWESDNNWEPVNAIGKSDNNVWESDNTGKPVNIVGKSDNNVWESDNTGEPVNTVVKSDNNVWESENYAGEFDTNIGKSNNIVKEPVSSTGIDIVCGGDTAIVEESPKVVNEDGIIEYKGKVTAVTSEGNRSKAPNGPTHEELRQDKKLTKTETDTVDIDSTLNNTKTAIKNDKLSKTNTDSGVNNTKTVRRNDKLTKNNTLDTDSAGNNTKTPCKNPERSVGVKIRSANLENYIRDNLGKEYNLSPKKFRTSLDNKMDSQSSDVNNSFSHDVRDSNDTYSLLCDVTNSLIDVTDSNDVTKFNDTNSLLNDVTNSFSHDTTKFNDTNSLLNDVTNSFSHDVRDSNDTSSLLNDVRDSNDTNSLLCDVTNSLIDVTHDADVDTSDESDEEERARSEQYRHLAAAKTTLEAKIEKLKSEISNDQKAPKEALPRDELAKENSLEDVVKRVDPCLLKSELKAVKVDPCSFKSERSNEIPKVSNVTSLRGESAEEPPKTVLKNEKTEVSLLKTGAVGTNSKIEQNLIKTGTQFEKSHAFTSNASIKTFHPSEATCQSPKGRFTSEKIDRRIGQPGESSPPSKEIFNGGKASEPNPSRTESFLGSPLLKDIFNPAKASEPNPSEVYSIDASQYRNSSFPANSTLTDTSSELDSSLNLSSILVDSAESSDLDLAISYSLKSHVTEYDASTDENESQNERNEGRNDRNEGQNDENESQNEIKDVTGGIRKLDGSGDSGEVGKSDTSGGIVSKVQLTESRIESNDSKVQASDGKDQLSFSKVQTNDSRIGSNGSKIQTTDAKIHPSDSKVQINDSKVQLTKIQPTKVHKLRDITNETNFVPDRDRSAKPLPDLKPNVPETPALPLTKDITNLGLRLENLSLYSPEKMGRTTDWVNQITNAGDEAKPGQKGTRRRRSLKLESGENVNFVSGENVNFCAEDDVKCGENVTLESGGSANVNRPQGDIQTEASVASHITSQNDGVLKDSSVVNRKTSQNDDALKNSSFARVELDGNVSSSAIRKESKNEETKTEHESRETSVAIQRVSGVTEDRRLLKESLPDLLENSAKGEEIDRVKGKESDLTIKAYATATQDSANSANSEKDTIRASDGTLLLVDDTRKETDLTNKEVKDAKSSTQEDAGKKIVSGLYTKSAVNEFNDPRHETIGNVTLGVNEPRDETICNVKGVNHPRDETISDPELSGDENDDDFLSCVETTTGSFRTVSEGRCDTSDTMSMFSCRSDLDTPFESASEYGTSYYSMSSSDGSDYSDSDDTLVESDNNLTFHNQDQEDSD